MSHVRWTKMRVAGVAGGEHHGAGVLVAAGSTLTGGAASAQSPSPSPSPSASPSPSPGSGRQGQGPHIGRMDKGDRAERLAQALNIPQDRVEQAFEQLRDRARDAAVQRLAPAATELGVTAQQLADAMRAAAESLHQNRMDGQRPDRAAYYDAVARELGGSTTGAQVQAALEALRDAARQNRPDRQQIEQRMQERLQELAGLLGVSVDQLRAAMEEIRGSGMGGPGMGGRSFPGPRGR
jgi:hypothetical protein